MLGPPFLIARLNVYFNAWMSAWTHPRIDTSRKYRAQNKRSKLQCINKCQRGGRLCHQRHPPRRFTLGVRLCSVGTEQRRTPLDGRKDLESFLPSCTRQICLVGAKQSYLVHDGRKDSRSFLPLCPDQEKREDVQSSLPSCSGTMVGRTLSPSYHHAQDSSVWY